MRWRRPARRLGGTGDGFGVILQHAFAPPPVPMIYETTSLLRLVSGRGGFDG